jgi:hypothetical protein
MGGLKQKSPAESTGLRRRGAKLGGDDAHYAVILRTALTKHNFTGDSREKRVIPTHADIVACVYTCAALAH